MRATPNQKRIAQVRDDPTNPNTLTITPRAPRNFQADVQATSVPREHPLPLHVGEEMAGPLDLAGNGLLGPTRRCTGRGDRSERLAIVSDEPWIP